MKKGATMMKKTSVGYAFDNKNKFCKFIIGRTYQFSFLTETSMDYTPVLIGDERMIISNLCYTMTDTGILTEYLRLM